MAELASLGFKEEGWYATGKLAKHSRQLETELAEMREELATEHKSSTYFQSQLSAEREKVAKLKDIISRASTKFCEDGTDGEIAAEMLRILGESKYAIN